MTLRIVLTDGSGIAGLSGTFGSFLNTAAPDAAASAAAAKASATASANSATASANSATASANSATNASNSASQAATSASNASISETNAGNSATNSANSAGQAASSATAAGNSATAASTSATNAGTSATNATNSATLSKNWATQMGSTVDGTEYSSKYYATQSQTSATNAANSATAAAGSATNAANSAGALNGELILDVSAADVVLNTTQLANGIFKFTGALTGNRKVTFPASPKTFTVQNLTTGIYTLTIIALGQTPSASVVQGKSSTLFSDATGVYATSAAAGMQFAAVYAQAGNFNVAINHLGAMIEQSTVGSTTTFPKANTYPAGSGFGYSNRSTGTTIIALQAGDTADLTFPYTTLTNDLYYWYSDGVSVWKLGWYANKYGPKFDTGITFGDGTTQTTANSTTQPAGQWYVVGSTDTVGSFADGDTAIRTSGFTAPFVRVIKNGLVMTRGQHFTLNADNIHVNFTEPLSKLDELNVETQGVYNPSSTYLPSMSPLLPAVGASFIAFAHTVGFAWLMQRGVWLEPGVDYTEDATGFTLVGFTADGVEKFFVFNLNAIGIANALLAASPVIKSGVLTFADGTTQNSAAQPIATSALSGRNVIINGNAAIAQRASGIYAAGVGGYGGPDRFTATNGTGAGGQFTQSQGNFTYNGVQRWAVVQTVNTVVGSLASTSYWTGICQVIEGFNCYHLANSPMVVSFLFNTNVPGVYPVSVRDGPASRSYVTSFNATGVPQYVSIAIPAGALGIGVNNSSGLVVNIGAQNGGTYATPTLNAWQNGNFMVGSAAYTQWGLTLNGFIAVSELQVEAGLVATPFERRSYGQEFALCQRYFINVGAVNGVPAVTGQTNSITVAWPLPVTMRTNPPAITTNITAANFVGTAAGANQWAIVAQGIAWMSVSSGTLSVSTGANNNCIYIFTTGATFNVMGSQFSMGSGTYLYASAEL